VAVVAVKAHVKHAVKAQHVHRATAPRHPAEMDHRAHKAPRALKVRATAAAKVATVTVAVAVVAKSKGAIPVLTTVAMAKAVPHRAVLVLKVVAQVAALRAAMANTPAVKTADATMATSCPATSTP
jgi:hypothetical protein